MGSQNNIVESEKILVDGMGAIIHENGVFFRVWAPNAQEVIVFGSFNDWDSSEFPLEHEGNGYWGGNVFSAKAGDEYKFFLKTPSGDLQRNDPYARKLTNSIGNSIIYDQTNFDWEEDDFQMPTWNKLVIYELHVGTYHVKEKGKVGDFYSLIEKLDYLQQLGINAIEVMPPFEFPGDFSWGYNPSYPFAIESSYGGPDAFKAFIKAAHQRGIAVILDVVYNHFGPTDMDMWQFDGWQENGLGGIYFYNDWRSATPWGDTRPDYGRPEVRQYIRDNAIMWLEEFRVDGLRMDMTPYIRSVKANEDLGTTIQEGLSLIRIINAEVAEKYPWKIVIAEDLHGLDSITDHLGNECGLGFGSQWDANFVHPIRNVLITQEDENRSIESVCIALLNKYSGDTFKRVVYTESHDEVANGKARVAEEIAFDNVNNWYSKKRASLGIALVMTAGGIPMLFQGQELLEDKWFSDTDPIDWSRAEKFKSFTSLHRDLIKLRLNHDGNTEGLTGQNTQIIKTDEIHKIIVFQRWSKGVPGDNTVVILNFSNKSYEDFSIGFPQQGIWKLRFNSDWEGYDKGFDNFDSTSIRTEQGEYDGMQHHASISIAPYTALIFSQDKMNY
ncbi:alpha-amylase family glycosyl hydrolase [Arcicella aquatica]|uniref:1,4-alpha-glucan branching enzyme n=1 Tax=Arcicella aquatica TaxID=217141 RepID=A0ABU5QUA4_9BACT|nr:alpha-amylase family glycosyl hydrolase [Arcicella aquatica]MEA5260687.1 alpha-amylase family glycosyl hydrolase [Arcicella aquatica]